MDITSGKTILIVEDEHDIAWEKAGILEKYDFTPIIASGSEEALKIIKTNYKINLILMDTYPGYDMDGIDLAELILRIREVPVIFLSTHDSCELLEKMDKIISYGYILKNSPEAILIASIKIALKLYEENKKGNNNQTKGVIEQKDFIQSISENMPGIIYQFYATNEGKYGFNYISEGTINIFGIRKIKETFFNDFTSCIPEEDKDNFLSSINKAVKSSTQWNYEGRFIKPSGETIWFNGISTPRKQAEEIIFNGILLDITARKKAENNLRDSEERFRRLADNAPGVIYRMSIKDGTYEYVSPASKHILGYSPDEFYSNPLLIKKVIHPDWIEYFQKKWHNLSEGIIDPEYEYQIINKNGEIRWIHQNNILIRDGDNIPSHIEGIVSDITEKKSVEDTLMKERKFLRLVIDNVPGFICVKTKDGLFRLANETIAEAYGTTAAEMEGKSDSDFSPTEEQVMNFRRDDLEVINSKKRKVIAEEKIKYADGSTHWLTTIKVPLIDDKGDCNNLLVVTSDITDRKLQQEDLQRKNEELERFTYSVSHDLRSPLITIKGFAGMVIKDHGTGNYNKMDADLKRIIDAADKMSTLLNDLLNLSRIGQVVSQPADIDMKKLIKELLALLAVPIGASKTKVMIQKDLPDIKGDRQRLKEVFQNLIENSLKFMGEQSEPKIDIGWKEKGKNIIFFVKDNGMGIEEKYHENIFGLFNKLDGKTGGSGIGLSLVKRIIECHNGKIWVESEGKGKGSAFYFTIPLTAGKTKEEKNEKIS